MFAAGFFGKPRQVWLGAQVESIDHAAGSRSLAMEGGVTDEAIVFSCVDRSASLRGALLRRADC